MSITLLRHCQSLYNEDHNKCEYLRNLDLSNYGQEIAKTLDGHYNLVIISHMKRTINTLKLSSITFDDIEINPICREHKKHISDFTDTEDAILEDYNTFSKRVLRFREYLDSVIDSRPNINILIIGHGGFFKELSKSLENPISYFENGRKYIYNTKDF